MKKVPLTRKTPLRASAESVRKWLDKVRQKFRKKPKRGRPKGSNSTLPIMSKKKSEWNTKYSEARKSGSCYVRPADAPFALEHKDLCDPHHPFGRKAERIMCFIWITKDKHKDIHDNGKKARLHGWIHPPFWGMPLDPAWPRPWPQSDEENWPEKYKRLC